MADLNALPYQAAFTIRRNGTPLQQILPYPIEKRIQEIEIKESISAIDVASFSVVDPEMALISIANSEAVWSISLGWQHLPEEKWKHFVGVAMIETPDFPEDGIPIFKITLVNHALSMAKDSKAKGDIGELSDATIRQMIDKRSLFRSMIARIAADNGLRAIMSPDDPDADYWEPSSGNAGGLSIGNLAKGFSPTPITTPTVADLANYMEPLPIRGISTDLQYLTAIRDQVNRKIAARLSQMGSDQTTIAAEQYEFRIKNGDELHFQKVKTLYNRLIPLLQYAKGNGLLLKFKPRLSQMQKDSTLTTGTVNALDGYMTDYTSQNPNTQARSLDQLQAQGLVEIEAGSRVLITQKGRLSRDVSKRVYTPSPNASGTQDQLNAQYQTMLWDIEGSGSCLGLPPIEAGMLLALDGLSAGPSAEWVPGVKQQLRSFNRLYQVKECRHYLDGGIYMVDFEVFGSALDQDLEALLITTVTSNIDFNAPVGDKCSVTDLLGTYFNR